METIKSEVLTNIKKTFVLFLCVWGGIWIARADDLIVLKGSSARIAVDGIQKVTVANPAVIDAKPALDGLSVLVSGLAEGNSQLRIERSQGGELVTNVVVRSDLNEMLDQIKALLSDVEGLDIKIMGNKVVLAGKILTKSDQDKVTKVVGIYGNVILNMSSFDTSGMSRAYEQAILQEIGLENISARVTGDTVILVGVVYSAADLKRAEQIAKLKIPNVINLLTVQDVMIETDVQFVSIDVAKGHNLGYNVLDTLQASAGYGLNYNQVLNQPLVTTNGIATTGPRRWPVTFGLSASGNAQLVADLLRSNGKVVDAPHLSTKNGETGSFQSGATAYLNAPGAQGVGNLIAVDYGVILKVKPTLQGRDRVVNEVTIEVSTPVPAGGTQFTVQKYNTICTSVSRIGESMVISGLTQTIAAGNHSGTPLLGDVPLLNLFFSSNTSDKERHEFVIVVTPRPVFPSPAFGQPFGEQHKDLLQDVDMNAKSMPTAAPVSSPQTSNVAPQPATVAPQTSNVEAPTRSYQTPRQAGR